MDNAPNRKLPRLRCDCEAEVRKCNMHDVTPDHYPPCLTKHECPECGRWWDHDQPGETWEPDN